MFSLFKRFHEAWRALPRRESVLQGPEEVPGVRRRCRLALIDSRFSTVICAPDFSIHDGFSTQVAVGVSEGLKHEGSVHCDELVSLPKAALTNYVGILPVELVDRVNAAVRVALGLPDHG